MHRHNISNDSHQFCHLWPNVRNLPNVSPLPSPNLGEIPGDFDQQKTQGFHPGRFNDSQVVCESASMHKKNRLKTYFHGKNIHHFVDMFAPDFLQKMAISSYVSENPGKPTL